MVADSVTISALDVVAWLRWAELGATDEEKEARRLAIKKYLFPPGLGFIELALREFAESKAEQLLEEGTPPNNEEWPAPRSPGDPETPVASTTPTEEPLPELARERWQGFISPNSRAYRRGSLHDGTARENARMRENAKGSPFDVSKKKS